MVLERLGSYEMFDRELFVLEIPSPEELPSEFSLPCPSFACLVAWDARSLSSEVLTRFAEKLIRAGCAYVCCWGPACERVHDSFDTVNVKLRPAGPWAMTTWHKIEPLSEAIWFLLHCAAPADEYFDTCRAAIGITIGSPTWAAEVRAALSDPSEFSAKIVGSGAE